MVCFIVLLVLVTTSFNGEGVQSAAISSAHSRNFLKHVIQKRVVTPQNCGPLRPDGYGCYETDCGGRACFYCCTDDDDNRLNLNTCGPHHPWTDESTCGSTDCGAQYCAYCCE